MAIGTKITVEEFERWAELPENADKLLEYVGGEIIEVVSNNYVSLVAVRISARLQLFAEEHDLGYVTGADGGYRVSGEDYIPDVAFISKTKQSNPSHDAYNPNPPDLAVEVVSPSDTAQKLQIKIGNYLAAGTRVWVVYPETKEVVDYAPGQLVNVLDENDTLSGGDLLPGFELAVKVIFPAE